MGEGFQKEVCTTTPLGKEILQGGLRRAPGQERFRERELQGVADGFEKKCEINQSTG